ncbi:helix-turn-helix domain-containing protein [Psychromicrobium xiongbiense]|uniref:helix-turn-helix domain-containing protein n=1 Tax=Psychromicrobium xiongbiense TaxID=3051184 RepID=UPI002552A607|nr:helix-turn-helix domain-containing protein [Psychromicrobium sp. YIM S02556]
MLAEYSKQALPKLARLDAIDAALARAAAEEPGQPRRKSGSPRQRYRLVDRLGKAKLDEIVGRYKAGESANDIAREMSVSKSSLLRLLDNRGIDRRKKGLTPEIERQVLELRKQGLIIRAIAKQVGVSYDTARLFLLGQGKPSA